MDELLIDLYACPTDRARWPAVLDEVCRTLGVRSAVVQLLVKEQSMARAKWIVRDSASERERDLHDAHVSDDKNPRLRTGRGPRLHAHKMILRDRDFFAPDSPELHEMRERLAAIRLGMFLGAGVTLPGGECLVLALHRDLDDDRDFAPEEEQFVTAFMPHLRQTVLLSEQLDAARSHGCELQEAVDRMRCGVVLCGLDARPSWANRAAERIFAKRDSIWINGDRLTTASSQETAALRRMVAEAAQDSASAVPPSDRYLLLGRSSANEPLQVLIQPLAGRPGPTAPGNGALHQSAEVLLLISESGAASILPPDLIARVFALSPTESRLAAALCQGLTIKEYAASHGVSEGTARFQLKQVLAKTQASRQSELVRRLCSSVVAHAFQYAV